MTIDWQQLDLDEVASWPKGAQRLLLALVAVLLLVVTGWLYWLPQQADLQQLLDHEQQQRMTLLAKSRRVVTLPDWQQQLDQLQQRYQLLIEQLPEQKELASMLAAVNELGLQHGLTFTRIDWGQRQPEQFLYRLPLNLEVTGSFASIGAFCAAIADLPRIIVFDSIDWQRVSQESSTLHFRVRAYTYQFNPEYQPDES
ncbi:type 4a pilus biogenesis protein PilO [Vibrio sp.]|uniref:type 4a pilus biogenesis protein PilO n=1 Tax=Vibrio sp. TaxID=678 RepID=UPI003D0CA22B